MDIHLHLLETGNHPYLTVEVHICKGKLIKYGVVAIVGIDLHRKRTRAHAGKGCQEKLVYK